MVGLITGESMAAQLYMLFPRYMPLGPLLDYRALGFQERFLGINVSSALSGYPANWSIHPHPRIREMLQVAAR
jgi:hypothetical protein